jgi:hypothetical protein
MILVRAITTRYFICHANYIYIIAQFATDLAHFGTTCRILTGRDMSQYWARSTDEDHADVPPTAPRCQPTFRQTSPTVDRRWNSLIAAMYFRRVHAQLTSSDGAWSYSARSSPFPRCPSRLLTSTRAAAAAAATVGRTNCVRHCYNCADVGNGGSVACQGFFWVLLTPPRRNCIVVDLTTTAARAFCRRRKWSPFLIRCCCFRSYSSSAESDGRRCSQSDSDAWAAGRRGSIVTSSCQRLDDRRA